MKKILCLALCMIMVCSLGATAFAAGAECEFCGEFLHSMCYDCGKTSLKDDGGCCNPNCPSNVDKAASAGTTPVSYLGTGVEKYTVTVPAQLSPNHSGTVKLEGTWATNRKVTVSAPATVTLTNSLDGGTKTLNVAFAGISKTGDNTVSKSYTETISVANISDALFGTWSGVIEYTVKASDAAEPNLISFTAIRSGVFNYNLQAEEGMTFGEWVNSEYNTVGALSHSGYVVFEVFPWAVDSDSVIEAGKTYQFYGNPEIA